MSARAIIKTIRQNKLPFAVLMISFAFFLGAIMLGGRLIYRIESDRLSSQVTESLDRDVKTVQSFFSACLSDVEFIGNIPGLTGIVSEESGGDDVRTDAEAMLLMLVKSHPYYSRITIMDRKGMERMSLQDDQGRKPRIFHPRGIYAGKSDSYIGAAALGRSGFYSFVSTANSGALTVTIASPIYASGGAKAGIVSVDISLHYLLGHLSKGTFFHSCASDAGHEQRGQKHLPFAGPGGTISLSDTESIPYRLVEYLPGSTVWMAQRFSSSPFKASMIKLETVSVGILAVFFLSVLVIGFFNVRHLRSVNTVQKAIIHSLANLSEWRDPETGSHLERTRSFCVLLAKTLRENPRYERTITDDFIEALYDAVPLHDIGKVGIRDDILLKPSRLSREEFDSMKQHVSIGRDIIQDIIDRFRLRSRFLVVSKNICHYHHEKYDGSGYPDGLRGDAIPLEARIFAICDVYDALRAKRPYKEGLTHRQAVDIIVPDKGRHFDPDVVEAFVACGDRMNEIFQVYKLFDDSYGKMMGLRTADALKIQWTADLAVGFSVIDAQHREFVERVNALFSSIALGEGRKETLRAMKFLHEYAVHHFATEEQIMERHEYPRLAAHKAEHAAFLRNLLSLRKEVSSEEDISSAHVVMVNAKVVDWIVGHIITSDKRFGDFLAPAAPIADWKGNEGRSEI
ncbi:MAG: bacteriohemerythrin [Nitrospiraceae bacterium]|nr:bacteriohemerythrin [Nitrospiraceae bacterium]